MCQAGDLPLSHPGDGGGGEPGAGGSPHRLLSRLPGGLAHGGSPDGTLTDPDTGREYYCLFWEGTSRAEYDLSRGFVVPGAETAAFLEDTLDTLGLNQREADEFIIYWLPRMEENPYNLITFQTRAYTDTAVLEVDPRPDTVIRVFMAWKGLEEPVAVEAQPLEPAPERRGFTLVEWGGTEVH